MKLIYLFIILLLSCDNIKYSHSQLFKESNKALTFCKKNKLNTDFYIQINMNIHSGKKRLFVYDFKTDSVILSGLCSHGCGNFIWSWDLTRQSPSFSNVPNSYKSSLGKYKIGKRGYSNWGIHINYKLHGLEKTNNNAFRRHIVLHSWKKVKDKEIYPRGTAEGAGCPAVSNNTMKKLDKLLRYSKKPTLLWIKNE